MRETLKLGIYLFIICAVAALSLAATDRFTFDRIQAAKARVEQEALQSVLPTAKTFKLQKDYYTATNAAGEPDGYILKVTTRGYSSQIGALVGVDLKWRVTGVKVLSQTETPGLGTKIAAKPFLNQFAGKSSEQLALKVNGGAIDAVTSATISSRAITNAIREKLNEFQKSH
jgi:electron transport complex protein RnfG